MVWEALKAAEALEAEGICADVIDVATIKPLDTAALLASLRKTHCAVVAEEHNMAGGLGEAVAGAAAAGEPVPIAFVNGEACFADHTGKIPEKLTEAIESFNSRDRRFGGIKA